MGVEIIKGVRVNERDVKRIRPILERQTERKGAITVAQFDRASDLEAEVADLRAQLDNSDTGRVAELEQQVEALSAENEQLKAAAADRPQEGDGTVDDPKEPEQSEGENKEPEEKQAQPENKQRTPKNKGGKS